MMKGAMNAQIKPISADIAARVDQLLQVIGNEKEVDRYSLELFLIKKKNRINGEIYTNTGAVVDKIDALSLFVELGEQHLDKAPALIKKQVLKQLGEDGLKGVLLQVFDQATMVCTYNEEDEIVFFKVVGEQREQVLLADLITQTLID